MKDWIDRDLVVYTLKKMKREPWSDDATHRMVISTSNMVIGLVIEMVKKIPSNMRLPEEWKEDEDE